MEKTAYLSLKNAEIRLKSFTCIQGKESDILEKSLFILLSLTEATILGVLMAFFHAIHIRPRDEGLNANVRSQSRNEGHIDNTADYPIA